MATSEATPKRRDVVVVPFPYADRFAEKRRPALVVSSDRFNSDTGLLWVAMITSTVKGGWNGDIAIPAGAKSGLTAASTIRTAKLATIETSRVVRVAGRIDAKTAGLVKKHILETVA